MIYLTQQIEQTIQLLNTQIQECSINEVDYAYLVVARDALASQLVVLKQSLPYKMSLWNCYGVPLDGEGVEALQDLVGNVGYDQVNQMFGDEVYEALVNAEE